MSHSKDAKEKKSPEHDSGDEWVNDIVLVSKAGTRFPASKVLLGAKSPVFRDMIAKCLPDKDNKDASSSRSEKVQLDDEDAEIQALVEHLHRPDRFLKAVIPELTKEGAQNLKSLTSIAFKYNMKGVLRQVQACLSTRVVLEAFTARHGDGDILDTWLFACRYHLKDVLMEVEDLVQSQPSKMKTALSTASSRVRELPTDSQSVAFSSLARMLQGTISVLSTVASKCESVLSAVRKHRAEDPGCPHLPRYVEDYLEYPIRLFKKPKT